MKRRLGRVGVAPPPPTQDEFLAELKDYCSADVKATLQSSASGPERCRFCRYSVATSNGDRLYCENLEGEVAYTSSGCPDFSEATPGTFYEVTPRQPLSTERQQRVDEIARNMLTMGRALQFESSVIVRMENPNSGRVSQSGPNMQQIPRATPNQQIERCGDCGRRYRAYAMRDYTRRGRTERICVNCVQRRVDR